ncbi:MAG: ATP-binding protein, partial [Nanoarchaeota archaeon]|nr:ATP-binding protein [Nanoarchaeota archaeon]
LGTKLTGRHVDIRVQPFSFSEFLNFKNVELNKNFFYKTESKIQVKNYFDEYLIDGGMPEFLIYNDPELLTRNYEDIIVKDIAIRYSVDNISLLRNLYLILISNFSNKFSFNSLRKITEINSVNTVKKFIAYLEETYFCKIINKFDYSLKKQLVNEKKFI